MWPPTCQQGVSAARGLSRHRPPTLPQPGARLSATAAPRPLPSPHPPGSAETKPRTRTRGLRGCTPALARALTESHTGVHTATHTHTHTATGSSHKLSPWHTTLSRCTHTQLHIRTHPLIDTFTDRHTQTHTPPSLRRYAGHTPSQMHTRTRAYTEHPLAQIHGHTRAHTQHTPGDVDSATHSHAGVKSNEPRPGFLAPAPPATPLPPSPAPMVSGPQEPARGPVSTQGPGTEPGALGNTPPHTHTHTGWTPRGSGGPEEGGEGSEGS